MEPKIYFVQDKEIHMVGKTIGVAWITKDVVEPVTLDNGTRATTLKVVRVGQPYIDGFWIRKDSEGERFYEDEDSPFSSGFTPEWALQIADELKLAVEYYNSLSDESQQVCPDVPALPHSTREIRETQKIFAVLDKHSVLDDTDDEEREELFDDLQKVVAAWLQ